MRQREPALLMLSKKDIFMPSGQGDRYAAPPTLGAFGGRRSTKPNHEVEISAQIIIMMQKPAELCRSRNHD